MINKICYVDLFVIFLKYLQDIAFQKESGFNISFTTYDRIRCLLIAVSFHSLNLSLFIQLYVCTRSTDNMVYMFLNYNQLIQVFIKSVFEFCIGVESNLTINQTTFSVKQVWHLTTYST